MDELFKSEAIRTFNVEIHNCRKCDKSDNVRYQTVSTNDVNVYCIECINVILESDHHILLTKMLM
jgi:hypothetical protein